MSTVIQRMPDSEVENLRSLLEVKLKMQKTLTVQTWCTLNIHRLSSQVCMLFALKNSLSILPDQKYIACKRTIKYGYDIISQLLPKLSMPVRLQTEMSEVQWFLEQTFSGIAKKFWMLSVPFL